VADSLTPIWLGRTHYQACWRLQNQLHALRSVGQLPDLLLLTEHEHVYTTGRRRGADHLLLTPDELIRRGIEYVHSDRGGDITYHGPGQLVGYPILRLQSFHGGVVGYLRRLELGLIQGVAPIGVKGHVREGLTGVWTERGKLASIGVRVSASVTLHGFALNVNPDLTYFDGIIPCGISGCSMTSVSIEAGRRIEVSDTIGQVSESVAEVLELDLGSFRNDGLGEQVQHMLGCISAAPEDPAS
jgi:lipoyl(octanoyl) transferase